MLSYYRTVQNKHSTIRKEMKAFISLLSVLFVNWWKKTNIGTNTSVPDLTVPESHVLKVRPVAVRSVPEPMFLAEVAPVTMANTPRRNGHRLNPQPQWNTGSNRAAKAATNHPAW
jgi:hypothetical protein